MEGCGAIRVRYMGDNMVLLSGNNVSEMVEENKEWLSKFFIAIEPWSPDLMPGKRLVWLRCLGIPINIWNKEGIGKVAARFGEVVMVAESSLKLDNIQYARALVRTASHKPIDAFMKMKVNRSMYNVRVFEEVVVGTQCCHKEQNTQ